MSYIYIYCSYLLLNIQVDHIEYYIKANTSSKSVANSNSSHNANYYTEGK